MLTPQAVPDVVVPRWNMLPSVNLATAHRGGDKEAHALTQGPVWDVRQLFSPHSTWVALKIKGSSHLWI